MYKRQTVHKAQGSEFEHVLLALPNSLTPSTRRLLTREIIYTGLTRAKQTVTIHSTRDALLQACLARVERDSGIALWNESMDDPTISSMVV